MATVRAGVFLGDGTHEIREFAMPEPPQGGAVLRVEAVGLCGSDLAQHHGAQMVPGGNAYPVVPGHEIVGRIDRLGRGGAEGLGVCEGDRVAVNEIWRCGTCAGCRAGGGCRRMVVYGCSRGVDDGPGLWGGYGEYMVLLPHTELLRLPDRIPPEELTLFESLANAVNWVQRVEVKPGETVVVQGPGHQGLAVLQAVLAFGATRVVVTGTAADGLRLEAARGIGAHHAIDVQSEDPVARVRELTGGRMADVVIDVATAPETVPLAVELVRPGGRILLAGFKHRGAIEGLDTDQIVVRALTVVGGSGFTPASLRTAIELLESGAVDPGPLRGEVYALEQLDEALALLARELPGRDAVRVGIRHA